ncbi:MAG: hypothetical protein ACR5K2_04765 [Wolbachia sp.]
MQALFIEITRKGAAGYGADLFYNDVIQVSMLRKLPTNHNVRTDVRHKLE